MPHDVERAVTRRAAEVGDELVADEVGHRTVPAVTPKAANDALHKLARLRLVAGFGLRHAPASAPVVIEYSVECR
jgi:hypothetical protein